MLGDRWGVTDHEVARRYPCDEHEPGDAMSRLAGRIPVGRVVDVVPGQQLTVAVMGALLSYVLVPQDGRTRLLMKVVLPHRHWWNRPLALGDLPIARKQLLTWKALAERS